MKVAFVTDFPRNIFEPQGGVQAVSVNLVDALAKMADLEIHVVTLDPGSESPTTTARENVSIHRLPRPRGFLLLTALTSGRHAVCSFVKSLKPDLVHTHDTYGLMVKGLELPKVFTIHGFIYADTHHSKEFFPAIRSALWRLAETSGWADKKNIISISPYVRARLEKEFRGKIHDIENPIGEKFFDIKRQEKAGLIFSSASISPRKNTIALIEAIKILADGGVDASLRLAGKIADRDYGAEVVEKIEKSNLGGKVTLLGPIPADQVVEELSHASIFTLVSLEENAPLAIEEAMAAGVPVVASNRCGMPYMVDHGKSGYLVDPENPIQIAEHIKELLSQENLRISMGRYSKILATKRFHPQRVCMQTHQVYCEVLSTN